MLARFDHRPMLTAVLALSTTVLVVVVITLSTLLYTSAPPAASPPSVGSGNPGAAAPENMDAGGENYGWDILYKEDHNK
jgi:heme/copper-type cytochrome/quinol oxidase subunit 2